MVINGFNPNNISINKPTETLKTNNTENVQNTQKLQTNTNSQVQDGQYGDTVSIRNNFKSPNMGSNTEEVKDADKAMEMTKNLRDSITQNPETMIIAQGINISTNRAANLL